MENLSRHLKGILCIGDITDGSYTATREKSLTLRHYKYGCERARNNNGLPYGHTLQTILEFTVRVIKGDDCMPLYRYLADRCEHAYSFVFNANFSRHQELESWDEAMIMKGYLVDMDEQFSSSTEGEDAKQMTVKGKILLTSVLYLGENGNNRLLDITH